MSGNKLQAVLAVLIICAVLYLIAFTAGRSHSPAVKQRELTRAAFPQNPKPKNAGQSRIEEIKKHFPKVDFDAPLPTDPSEKAKRLKKGKHYDNGYINKQATHYSSGLISEWDVGLAALPVGESNAVVVVKTLKGGAFLSNDRTGIYTELSAKIEEVLKTDGGSVGKGTTIDISRMGGVVRYRTGEESLFRIVGQNMPNVGRRYLLFLKAIPESDDFQIITGYEFGPSGVKALDDPSQFQRYNGIDESNFLQIVRQAIAN